MRQGKLSSSAHLMDHAEQKAKFLIELLIPGAVMQYREDQSTSTHDFDLKWQGEWIAAVEVTTATNEQRHGSIAAIQDERKGGSLIPTEKCRKGWIIHPSLTANITKIRKNVDQYLADIEDEGLEKFFSPRDSWRYPAVGRIYHDLHIEGGRVTKWKKPGYIGLILPSDDGGILTPERVQEAVKREAWKPDNRQKLKVADSKERHLFVYLDGVDFLPWASLRDTNPSSLEPPQLPPEITHVWAAAHFMPIDETEKIVEYYKVWRSRDGEKWEVLGMASRDWPSPAS